MNQVIKERVEKIKHGEVPEGYKLQYTYIIPQEWRVEKLGNLSRRLSVSNNQNRDIPAYSINNQVGFIPQAEQFEEGSYSYLDKSSYKLVKKCQFAYNTARINVGSIGLLKDRDEVIVSSLYVCFELIKHLIPIYFEYWIKTADFYKEIVRNLEGSVREYLFFENFSNIRMPVPPLHEQEKIAEILSTWDKAIFLMENLIEQKKKQQKWLMQNLLDPDSGVRLPGFEGEWKEKNIGELFKFLSSVPASRDQLGNKGFCYLHYGDIHKSKMTYINVEDEYESIPKLNIDKVPDNAILQDGDVVFVDASEDYEGASKYIVVENKFNRPFIAGLHTIGIRSKNDELNNEFKKYCFQSYSIKKQISFYASGIKVYGLSRDNLAKLIVKFPNIDEQKAIANIFSTADKEIYLLEQKLEQLQKQKKALMQFLLTGIVRVTA